MVVVVYVVTIIVFCLGAQLGFLILSPFLRIYTKLTHEVLHPKHPLAVIVMGGIGYLLMDVTKLVWQRWGYQADWLLASILLAIHFSFGNDRGANLANQSQAFSVALGLVVWIIVDLIR